jgi:hypothetical protein
MRIITIIKVAAAPAIIAGGLLATMAAPAAHAATLTAGGSNSISAHLTGKGAATYPDAVFGNVKVNETSHAKFDTVGATFIDGQTMTPGQTGSVGWNSDFANSGHQTGVLTWTVNADGTGYSGQATYPNG